jgi:hypothetical protein
VEARASLAAGEDLARRGYIGLRIGIRSAWWIADIGVTR